MSDENKNQESDQQENEELPTPSFSTESRGSTSDADALVSKLLAQLTPQLDDLISRKVQSTKDKRVDKIEKALGGRLDLLAELEGEGVQVSKEVRAELRLRELEEKLAQQTDQPVPGKVDGSTQYQKQAVTEAIAELSKYGLSSNDPGFIELLRGQYASKEAFDVKVKGFILEKVAPKNSTSPAGLTQAPATGGAASPSQEALTNEYIQKAVAARGNRSAIVALREEYAKKGVPVNQVSFT